MRNWKQAYAALTNADKDGQKGRAAEGDDDCRNDAARPGC